MEKCLTSLTLPHGWNFQKEKKDIIITWSEYHCVYASRLGYDGAFFLVSIVVWFESCKIYIIYNKKKHNYCEFCLI